MPPATRQQLEYLLRILLRWKWYAVVPAVVGVVAGAAYALVLPTVYTATATVSVDMDSPGNPLLRDLNVDQRRRERLSAVAEALSSFDILQQTVLDVGAATVAADSAQFQAYLRGVVADRFVQEREIPVEVAVDRLGAAIDVKQWGRDLVVIRYTGLDPAVAAQVTNSLVRRFVEHAARTRQQGARATVEFIAEQLDTYKQRLEESEAHVRLFREENLQALPTQFGSYLSALADARAGLMATEISLREAEQRVAFLRAQRDATDENIVAEWTTAASRVGQELESQIVAARVQLASLRTNYTEKHPRVVELQARIADLARALEDEEGVTVTSETTRINPAYESVVASLNNAEIERDSLRLRRTALEERIEQTESAIRGIPQQEQELVQLTRNSQVNERIYNLLLQKLEEAKISQRLAQRDRGLESFTVIQRARTPTSPSGPNRPVLLVLGVVAGLGAGVAGVGARQFLDNSFDDGDELAAAFDLPCLALIPRIPDEVS